MAGTIGGIVVIIYLLGYCIVSCLTTGAYDDHLVQAVYPTKESLRQRVRTVASQLKESEQQKWLEAVDGDDEKEPELDISRYGCWRCCCRYLFSRNCCCMLARGCWRGVFCCQGCQ